MIQIQPFWMDSKIKTFDNKYEDLDEYELQGELSQFLWDDNVDQLLALLDYLYSRRGGNNDDQFDQSLGKAMAYACWTGAVKCVYALINGNGKLAVDIHSPCYESLFPLHYAAQSGHPGVTELLLYHGARTDVRSNCSSCEPVEHPLNLPLHLALNQLGRSGHLWRTKAARHRSIAMLLIILCLPFMQNLLETIGLLAWKTNETKEELLHYARNGHILEVAVLLVVARKKLLDSSSAVAELVVDLTQSNAMAGEDEQRGMLDLLDIFHRVGDEIEAYVKRDKLEVTRLQVVSEVTCLLQKAGFHESCQDPLIRIFQCKNYEKYYALDVRKFYTQKVAEIGMPHYSTSSYRWASKESKEPGHYNLKLPNISDEKQLRDSTIPSWLSTTHELRASKYHTSVEDGTNTRLKPFGFNSSKALSSKSWALFAPFIKRIIRR